VQKFHFLESNVYITGLRCGAAFAFFAVDVTPCVKVDVAFFMQRFV